MLAWPACFHIGPAVDIAVSRCPAGGLRLAAFLFAAVAVGMATVVGAGAAVDIAVMLASLLLAFGS